MNASLGTELERHFDELAQEAPHAPAALVATARSRGDRRRGQVARGSGAGVVALALAIGLGTTQPWSRNTGTPAAGSHISASSTDSRTGETSDQHLAGSSWRLLRQRAGGREVEQYATVEGLLAAAPLLVRGTVTHVELTDVVNDPQVDQPYRDLLLEITPSGTAGPEAAGTGSVVVQLGPIFGPEADSWIRQMSTGPSSLIGDETLWALRPREDTATYRPLTSDSVFVRDGDGVLTPLTTGAGIGREIRSTTWSRLVAAAGLAG